MRRKRQAGPGTDHAATRPIELFVACEGSEIRDPIDQTF